MSYTHRYCIVITLTTYINFRIISRRITFKTKSIDWDVVFYSKLLVTAGLYILQVDFVAPWYQTCHFEWSVKKRGSIFFCGHTIKPLSSPLQSHRQCLSLLFKGTVVQIEKALIIDRLGVSKISWKFRIPIICNFCREICYFLKN